MLRLSQLYLAIFLTCVCGTAIAQVRATFVDWSTGITSTGNALFAATVNDSGNVLGQYCYPGEGSCIYLLGMRTSCKEGSKYPVLVNSDKGSLQVQVLCSGRQQGNLYEYVFTEFDKIDDVVMTAYRVGFAVPLEGDQFTVIRFSLIGSNEAVAKLLENAASRTVPARRGTRDQRL